jgi:hypothetical protein
VTTLFLLEPLEGPLTSLLEWLHGTVGLTWAWAIVVLTVIVRTILLPLTVRQIHSMQRLQRHAPEMKAIQERYKGDRPKQQEELMRFYKENKINPAASCLPILFQIPVFIALFFVLRDFEKEVFPKYPGSELGWLQFVPDIRPLVGLPPARAVCRQPDGVDAPDADDDGQDAAVHPARASDRLPLLRCELPGRARHLLGDDEPVDGRTGGRHARPPPTAAGAAEADVAYAARGRAAQARAGGGDRRESGAAAARQAQEETRRPMTPHLTNEPRLRG